MDMYKSCLLHPLRGGCCNGLRAHTKWSCRRRDDITTASSVNLPMYVCMYIRTYVCARVISSYFLTSCICMSVGRQASRQPGIPLSVHLSIDLSIDRSFFRLAVDLCHLQ